MHLESTRFSPSPESQTFSKHTLVRKSRTSANIFTCHSQVIPSFFKSRKKHDKSPRFGGAVSIFVCAVRVLVCAVRVFVCAVSILFVLWAIWSWCEVFVIVAINLSLLWVILQLLWQSWDTILMQTLSQSVAMATDLSFHFTCKLLHFLESFISSKSILIICSQVIHT